MGISRVGYWVSEKKAAKLDFDQFGVLCSKAGLELVKLDLDRGLESQGPFSALLHKVSDLVARAEKGSVESRRRLDNFTDYVANHPEVFVVDSLERLPLLLDRAKQYRMLLEACSGDAELFCPPFAELLSSDVQTIKQTLSHHGVGFPFICKPLWAHGSNQAHQMCVVFSEKSLGDVCMPGVAQSFVHHNAVLHKLFVVGDVVRVVRRPSLKNLSTRDNDETIFFDSHDVSKPDCCNALTTQAPVSSNMKRQSSIVLDEPSAAVHRPASLAALTRLASALRQRLQMNLLSIDVIVENDTGRHAVIDVNLFPGYEGVPDFFQLLLNLIQSQVALRELGVGALAQNPPEDPLSESQTDGESQGACKRPEQAFSGSE